MYSLSIRPELDKEFAKLSKKNRKQYDIILKKVEEIIQNPQHYKNLRAPLQHWKRVHIGDDEEYDVKVPKSVGIKSFLLCRSKDKNQIFII